MPPTGGGEGVSNGNAPNEEGQWMSKNGLLKPAKNFIGLGISTWALGRIWPNV